MNVFARDWEGPPFRLFGREHLLALTLVTIFQVVLLWRFRRAGTDARLAARRVLVTALWAQEVGFHAWKAATRQWSAQEMLPAHLCSQAVWLGGVMLLTRSQRLYDYVYYSGLAGAAQALATPDAGRYGWPHFRFVQFFVSHGLILTPPLWLAVVEGRRPSRGSALRAAAATIGTGLALIPLNRALGSNYMFSARKPDSASPLDRLPAWPGYLPFVAAGVVAAYGALALPWWLPGRRGR